MGRLLFWIVLIAVAVWLWRHFNRPSRRRSKTESGTTPMVRCAHCGVHVPQDRALQQDAHWYCSQDHLLQGPQRSDR
ncbi:hypothetical protein D3880_18965 [Pseudomonas cavernae]|uniref:MYND finger n=1 Tax=Pseudomonas cavernae TaxID=2320867 RepID=A0A385Z8Y5_9PSED|nr:PP0621 family protein [Pseudomonas cavernae]AYC35140.1 hypothetical protein D3880_18965 [Pseudomonas cavernae]